METIRLTTFQNIQVEYTLGSLGTRIGARFLDNFIRIAYIILIILVFVSASTRDNLFSNSSKPLALAGFFLLFSPALFYSFLFETFMNGQTPGKRSFYLKVASLDGKPVNIWQYFLRWIFLIIDNTTFGLIPMAITKYDQRIGDLVAGTTVISTKENNISDVFYGIKFPDNYIAKFPEAYQLSDKDISILKELINSFHETNLDRPGLISKAAEKIKSLLNINSNTPDRHFLEQIIKDYIFHFEKL